MSGYAENTTSPERKIRFRSSAKIHFNPENKVEDILRINHDLDKEPETDNTELKIKGESSNYKSLYSFLSDEVTRGYLLEHDEERYSARREKVYSFMKIPREVEKFMAYGFFQCADSFLFVYTFLPLRFLLAVFALITRPFLICFGLHKTQVKQMLTPAEICDLLKACILVLCSCIMSYIDTSMMYHLIKSQSVIKLYIFYNMLEVGDRLFSAFGQDTIDALFWTATEPRDRKRQHLGVIPHLLFAVTYVLLHSLLVLFQATTLNVAINSNNKALLTIMMSNNFVELKGSVFKKFDKNNLFQVSCSDVRERFHLFVLLFIVVLQTMKEYSWKEDRFWVLVPDCIMVLIAEVLVDWIKHAFITRFNELPVDVYKEYTVSLAYDMAETRQKHAFSDHSDLVARRMGFIPLPLGVVMIRILGHSVRATNPAGVSLLILSYLCLATFRILNTIVILGKASDLIAQHQQEKVTGLNSPMFSRVNTPQPHRNNRENTTKDVEIENRRGKKLDFPPSPRNNGIPPVLQRSITVDAVIHAEPEVEQETIPPPSPTSTLGPAAIFSNSAVSINNVCLNEQLRRVDPMPSICELTRSEPNIQDSVVQDLEPLTATPDELAKKRAESEPSIPLLIESDRTSVL